MTEPLSTVCDHCSVKLKLKNPDLEGKKIKCPKCGEAFVVAAAASASPTPAKKPVKKKTSDDDDLDFMDVDPDDYGPPPDDDDDSDDGDAPRGRRTSSLRGGKKKSKKKSKKRGGDSAQVIKILAIVLVVLAALGGGGFAMMTLLRGDGSSDVDWLPTDIEGYVKIQVDDIWAANVSQGFRNSAVAKQFVEEMTKHLSIGPQDVDRITVSFPPNGQTNNFVMVARSKSVIDQAKIQPSDPSFVQTSHNGTSYLKSNTFSLFLPDSKTLVFGPEALIKPLIERGKKNPSESKFAFGNNYRDHLVIVASNPSRNVRNSMAYPGGQDIESILIRANASSDIRMTMQGTFKTADAAKANVDKTKADMEKAKKDFATLKTQLQGAPPNPLIKADQILKMMNGTEQVMNSLQVSQSGTQVNMSLAVSGQLVTDFMEMAGSMPGSPLNRFSTPFGK